RCPKLLALKVFGCCYAAALAGDDREGRAVVNHEDRLDRKIGVLVAKLDERIDVAEAHVICARGDTLDGLDGAGRGVDGDVKAFGLIIAVVDCDQKRRGWPLELEIEAEFNRRLGDSRMSDCRHEKARCRTGYRRGAHKGPEKAEEAHKPIS